MKILLIFLFGLSICCVFGQFSDNFSDGDYTTNPSWFGETNWFVVDSIGRLKLNAESTAGTAAIATKSNVTVNSVWAFKVGLEFNPSSANFCRVYLMSTEQSPTSESSGVYVELGGTTDEISLYSRFNGIKKKLIDGKDKQLDVSNSVTAVRVTFSEFGEWELLVDTTGGNNYISLGTSPASELYQSTWFVVYCQFTSTRSDKFWFDDFYVIGNVENDPPKIEHVKVLGLDSVLLSFSEIIDSTSALNENNYLLNLTSRPRSITYFKDSILLIFEQQLNESQATLSVTGILDLVGNRFLDTSITITFFNPHIPQKGDLIFSEVMVDPSPKQGLPEIEYVEILNRSDQIYNLADFQLLNSGKPRSLESVIIQPGEYVILCDIKLKDSLQLFGKTCGVTGWLSLVNDADSLMLSYSSQGIAELNYDASWHTTANKRDGGYSLELIDVLSPCYNQPELWVTSNSSIGGTPGSPNSDSAQYQVDLSLTFMYFTETGLQICFNQPVIQIKNVSISNNQLNTGFFVDNRCLKLEAEFVPNALSEINLYEVVGCFSKTSLDTSMLFQIPRKISKGDLIINEVLYDPIGTGPDFMEVLNTTNDFVFTPSLIAGPDYTSTKVPSVDGLVFSPGEVIAFTPSIKDLYSDFKDVDGAKVFEYPLPNLVNSPGVVAIWDSAVGLLDKFEYNDSFHHTSLAVTEGVSLERCFTGNADNSEINWTSGITGHTKGSPGKPNSCRINNGGKSEITVSDQLLTPNGDGSRDDVLITLKPADKNMTATISVCDITGLLINQPLLGTPITGETTVTWDGTNANHTIVVSGAYILVAELFNETGVDLRVKKVIVVSH